MHFLGIISTNLNFGELNMLNLTGLQQAAAALNTKLYEGSFDVDLKTNSLITRSSFHTSMKDSMVLDYLEHIDEAVRKFSGQPGFKGVRHYVEFIPAHPGTTIEKYKDILQAQIKDEIVLKLLAEVGRLAISRRNFMKMSCDYFQNHPSTPACLKRITLESLLNSGVDIYFERMPSIYIRRYPENEALIAEKAFFKDSGIEISISKQKRYQSEEEYYCISCSDAALFQQKFTELRTALAKKSASTPAPAAARPMDLNSVLGNLLAKTEHLEKEVAALRPLNQKVVDLEGQISDLFGLVEAIENENVDLKGKYAKLSAEFEAQKLNSKRELSTQSEIREAKNADIKEKDAALSAVSPSNENSYLIPSPSAPIHRDSPLAPPITVSVSPQPKQLPGRASAASNQASGDTPCITM